MKKRFARRGKKEADSLLQFVSDLKSHLGGRLGYTIALIVAGAIVEGIGILLLVPILSIVLRSAPEGSWVGGMTDTLLSLLPEVSTFWQLLFLLVIFAIALALRGAIILARDVMLARLQVNFVSALRLETVQLLTKTRWDVLSHLRHGRITHVLGADIQASGDAAGMLLTSSVAAAMLIAQCLLAVFLSPPLALTIFVVLLVGALTLRPVLRRAHGIGEALTTANLYLVNATTQFLGGLKLALSQSLVAGFLRGFETTLEDVASRRIEFARQRTSVQLWLSAAAAFVAGFTILLGVGVLETEPSMLLAFLFVLARMNGPAIQLQAAAQNIFHAIPAYVKVKQLQSELETAKENGHSDAGAASPLEGSIELRNVSFRHGERLQEQEQDAGLFDVSLTIAPGIFLGIIGHSGSGKTTFADILVGLYPPHAGEIFVGGTRLDQATLLAWRQQVSYVSQDAFLFHASIRENLLWARPGAQEEDLWRALRQARADVLVQRMKEGMETVVGERGTLLSGGERQRLALARALLRRPRLLVLDEATNAVDVEGERAILEEIKNLAESPTIVMIAHRQSSLENCDQLIEFRNGRIVADGPNRG